MQYAEFVYLNHRIVKPWACVIPKIILRIPSWQRNRFTIYVALDKLWSAAIQPRLLTSPCFGTNGPSGMDTNNALVPTFGLQLEASLSVQRHSSSIIASSSADSSARSFVRGVAWQERDTFIPYRPHDEKLLFRMWGSTPYFEENHEQYFVLSRRK